MKKEYLNEIWKPIKGYEGLYEVSNFGRIKSLKRNIILKSYKDGRGYLCVRLYKYNSSIQYKVHRLVAEVFIDNPNNYKEVNHKDENKTNNRVENLEWCDRKYNCNYGTRNERMSKSKINGKRSKIVIQYNLDGTFVREWPSAMECERNGYNNICISLCCLGKLKTHRGFIWEYK